MNLEDALKDKSKRDYVDPDATCVESNLIFSPSKDQTRAIADKAENQAKLPFHWPF